MDDVIFFERLRMDTARICSLLDIEIEEVNLPRLKTGIRTPVYDTSDYYKPATRRKVADIFRPEIEAFGYSFPSDSTSSDPSQYRPEEVNWAKSG